MRPSRRTSLTGALAASAAVLSLAACGGADRNDSADATAASSDTGLVSIQSVEGTDVLADSASRTLYTAEVEKDGIECTGACTSIWAPIGASPKEAESASADLDLDFGVVNRPDGDRQLTLDGLPLYTFTEEGPGQLTGDGFVDDFEGTRFEWAAAITGADSGSGDSDAPSDSSPY